MVETTLPDGLEISGRKGIANFGISLDVFEFSVLDYLFCFYFFVFCVFLVHPTVVLVLLSASVERFYVSCMRDF